jgi:hypothetical protein
MTNIKKFFAALLGSAEQARHETILRQYTLPARHTMPAHTLAKAS